MAEDAGGAWQLRPGVPAETAAPKKSKKKAPPHVVEALKNTRLLSQFTDTGVGILGRICKERDIPVGESLFDEGAEAASLFVIVDGTVRLSITAADGNPKVLSTIGAGQTLGEAALLRAGHRLCTASADTDCKVLEITREDFLNLQKRKPQACIKLMMAAAEIVGERLAAADPAMRKFMTWTAG